MFFSERRSLVDLAAKNRLPAVFPFREFVDVGGLMANGPDLADLNRRAATYVDKILKGAKPGHAARSDQGRPLPRGVDRCPC